MISKQKLLQFIEDKKYVYTVEDYDCAAADATAEELAEWAGCLRMLNMIKYQIELGEFVVDNGEEVKG